MGKKSISEIRTPCIYCNLLSDLLLFCLLAVLIISYVNLYSFHILSFLKEILFAKFHI